MITTPQLPPAVRPGDRVGVAALSGIVDGERLDQGLQALTDLGFEVVEAANLRQRCGLFAGDDEQRVAAFHELVADPSLSAMFFARGGWGVQRILPRLDWQLMARYPRAYIGYSDLTPFLLQVVSRLGTVAFHGPMVAADLARGLDTDEQRSLLSALAGEFPATYRCFDDPSSGGFNSGGPNSQGLNSLSGVTDRAPTVAGPLLGGNLCMLTTMLGTPWAIDLSGALLFIEDLNEPPYRFDRMLTHLRLSGTLTQITGMVIGHLRADGESELTACDGEVTLGSVLTELAQDFPWPLVQGINAGHARPNLTLPLGLWARLDPRSGELQVDPAHESASGLIADDD